MKSRTHTILVEDKVLRLDVAVEDVLVVNVLKACNKTRNEEP
jgi:hypothetical protein